MAIDPRISLGVNVAPQVNVADIFNRVKQQQQGLEIGKQNMALNDQNAELNQQTISQNRDKQRLTNIHQTGQRLKPLIAAGDAQGAELFLLNNISQIQDRIKQGSGEDITESMDALNKIKAGDLQGVMGDITAIEGLVRQQQGQGASVGTRERNDLLAAYNQDPNSPSGQSAGVALGITPRAGTSAQERVATNPTLGAQVADQKSLESGATEQGKQPVIVKTEALKNAQARSEKAIDSIVSIRSEVGNLDEAIQAIDQGAESGRISNWLPSFRKSTIKLESAAKRLGLNVVTATTFGALSEGELKLAMDVAVPRDLQPQDLKDWLTVRRDARIKLSRELENMAIALGTEGITGSEYLKRQRDNDPLGLGL